MHIQMLFLLLTLSCTGRMLRMEPERGSGEDVIYRNGTPMVISRQEHSAVVVQPQAGPTGRYELGSRVGFIAAILNLGDHRLEISEDNFKVEANDTLWTFVRAQPCRLVPEHPSIATAPCCASRRMDALHRKFARRVRSLMATRALTANRLADFAGIGRGRLSEILAGKSSPTLRTVGRIASALGFSARELLPDDEPST